MSVSLVIWSSISGTVEGKSKIRISYKLSKIDEVLGRLWYSS